MAITNTVPTQPFVSTYAVLTAKRILELFKISLSDAEVRAAIQSRDTFYKHILTTYAVILSGYLSLGSAADLKDFCDQQLWDIEARKIEEQARVDVENVSPSTQSNTELLAVHDGFSDLKSHLENIQDALDKETA
ncbi:MAG: hypothetical protein JSS53_03930, partial [Proteobacteria bacterium]|nr:hypothetical protein [Pseudomonadota bacterium]